MRAKDRRLGWAIMAAYGMAPRKFRESLNMGMEPKVGMGVTVGIGSDRHAFTIVRVSDTKKSFWATQDTARRTDTNGMSESQTYEYHPAPEGALPEMFRLCPDGRWSCSWGKGVSLGFRKAYYDFSF